VARHDIPALQSKLGLLKANCNALDKKASEFEDELDEAKITISDLRFQLAHSTVETFGV
jgi:ribosomal protein L29